MKGKIFLAALTVALFAWPKTADAQCSTYGGRGTVIQSSGLNTATLALSDTGNINSTGGLNDASLMNASVPGLLTAEVLSATAGGGGSSSQSVASMANLNLTVAGNTIGAGFAAAHANASCASGGPTVNGSAEIDGLVVNGLSVAVTGSPNQTVSLLGGGYIILNEQTSSVQSPNGSITVNAMHVSVPGISDVVIASSSASVSGQLIGANGGGGPLIFVGLLLQFTGQPCAGFGGNALGFFTGGGWINTTSSASTTAAKKTFGVSGGVNPGGNAIGHLEYVDHGNPMINVHGTGVPTCFVNFPNPAISVGTIFGTAEVNHQGGCTYTVTVTDDDSGGPDMFGIQLADDGSNTCPFPAYSAGPSPLGGGDIEFHKD